MRWLEDNNEVTVFRDPSNNSNGNSFDYQGRQVSAEHVTRRVVRYEHDGTVTVLASHYEGKRLNSPNDMAHRIRTAASGSPIRRTAASCTRAPRTRPAARATATGLINPRVGQPPELGSYTRELPTNVYRLGPERPAGHRHQRRPGAEPERALLLAGPQAAVRRQHGHRSGDTRPGGTGVVWVFDITDDNRAVNQRLFTDCMVNGIKCGPDGLRTDVFGNVWISSNAGRNLGYSGVTVWNPEGKLIGRIRIPEVVGNITFGGPKRNRLFMAGSQSLYAVYTNTQGSAGLTADPDP